MKKNIIITALLLLTAMAAKSQNLTVQCGLAGFLNCDDREIVINLYDPAPTCGGFLGATTALTVWTGDNYTVNLTALWGGPLPASYQIYSVVVRNTCGVALAPGGGCGYLDGVVVGDDPCTGFSLTSACYELTSACGPAGTACAAGQVTNVTYTRNPITGDVLLQID